MVDLGPGTEISGYEIESMIGRGGMGEIWLARQLSIDRQVALKILSPKLVAKDPRFADRFIAEARAAGRLSHANIIAVHDVGEAEIDGTTVSYFSMEYVDGDNFRDIVDREGPCGEDTIANVMTAMADALGYAHSLGMIHRDIKPENIMLSSEGQVKLADFGLAMQVDTSEDVERDQAGRVKVMGTPLYMSPEQARGRQLDFRSDHYSLGASLYHLLTGRPPYRRPTSRETMRAHVHDPVPDPNDVRPCPEAWRRLCMRLLAKDPEQRMASPEALKQAVAAAVARPHAALPRRHRSGSGRRAKRLRPGLMIGAGAGLVGLVVLAVTLGGGDPPARERSPATTTRAESPSGDEAAAAALARARAVIADLPENPHQALRALEGDAGLRNPLIATEPAAVALLETERQRQQRRVADLRERAVAELERELAAITRRIQSGSLAGAVSALAEIPPERRRLAPQAVAATEEAIATARAAMFAAAIAEIEAASVHATIDHIVERHAERGLTPEQLAAIAAAADDQRARLDAELDRRQQERRQQLTATWNLFLDRLMDHRADPRSAPDLAGFRQEVEAHRSRFEEVTVFARDCQRLLELAAMAAATEEALASHLAEHQPIVEYGPARARFQAVSFDPARGLVRLSQLGSSVVIGHRIDAAELPGTELLTQALSTRGVEPVELHCAAYLWLWDHPGGDHLFTTTLADHPLTQTLRRVDDDLKPLRVDHRFDAGGGPADVFLGGELERSEQGLRFTPVVRTHFSEADYQRNSAAVRSRMDLGHLDHRIWRQTLRVPLRIDLVLEFEEQAQPLIGLAEGDRLIGVLRAAGRPIFLPAGIGDGLVLDTDRATEVASAQRRVHLRIVADESGSLQISVDEQEVPGLDLRLDPVQPLRLVIATVYFEGDATGAITIRRLAAQATRGPLLD